MSYRGHIENGVVVLDDGATLPEGTQVSVDPIPAQEETLAEMLLKHAGVIKDLPPDFATNHDFYLHGVPKP